MKQQHCTTNAASETQEQHSKRFK